MSKPLLVEVWSPHHRGNQSEAYEIEDSNQGNAILRAWMMFFHGVDITPFSPMDDRLDFDDLLDHFPYSGIVKINGQDVLNWRDLAGKAAQLHGTTINFELD